jgi:hypothetical protein
LVLPAGGAALCWLLLTTLWLPLLDFARSYKPWVVQVQAVMAQQSSQTSRCVMTYGLNTGQMTAFHYHGGFDVQPLDGKQTPQNASCEWLLVDFDLRPGLASVVQLHEWTRVRTIRRPSDNDEDITLYHRRKP